MNEATKRCLYCKEEILAEALKCKHCGAYLGDAAMLTTHTETLARERLQPEYEILEEIGRGGLGIVYRALQKSLDMPVAIKVLMQEFTTTPLLLKCFRDEARLAARLDHPNIVRILNHSEKQGVHFIAMEWVDGADLRKIILRDGPLPVDTVITWMKLVAEALDYIHEEGMVHRNLKTANILIGNDGEVKLTDFGFARINESAKFNHPARALWSAREAEISGPVQFMSPEQIKEKPVDHRSDIYSFGVVLYQCLTGRLPFQSDSDYATKNKIVLEPPTYPRHRRAGIPVKMEKVILHCMRKDPKNRYQNCRELLVALEAVTDPSIPDEPEEMEEPGAVAAGPEDLKSPVPVVRKPLLALLPEIASTPLFKKAAAALVSVAAVLSLIWAAQPHKDFQQNPIPSGNDALPEIPVARPSMEDSARVIVEKAKDFERQGQSEANKKNFEKAIPPYQRAVEYYRQASGLLPNDASLRLALSKATGALTKAKKALNEAGAQTEKRKWLGIELVGLKGGRFKMGDTFNAGDSDERPVHDVQSRGFRMSKCEITNAQYDSFCVATNRPLLKDNKRGANLPAANVSWHEAEAFCKWLGTRTAATVRLPTEAEWEYAARARGKELRWSGTSNADSLKFYARFDGSSTNGPSPVGQDLNANANGLYDMSGNVGEWCSDWYKKSYYNDCQKEGLVPNPAGPSNGEKRLVRGGSARSSIRDARCANRDAEKPNKRDPFIGFRIVADF